jgi:uncharacterized protein involved in exopolysaccharide biosynthesis
VRERPADVDESIADGLRGAPAGQRPGSGTLLDAFWRIVRGGTELIVLAVVATTVGAFVSSAVSEKRYTAAADVLFTSQDLLGTAAGSTDPARESATNEALLALPVIADRAAGLMAGEATSATPATVREAVSIVATPNSDLIRIEATTADPVVAARMANAYGTAFIDFRLEVAQAQIREAIDRARAADARLSAAEQGGARGASLSRRIVELEERQAVPSAGARLVQPASPPDGPSSPKPVRNAILGAIVGAALGFGLAAVRDRRRESPVPWRDRVGAERAEPGGGGPGPRS